MRLIYICLILIASPLSACAIADPTNVLATIKEIRTGWDVEQFEIVTNEQIVNPAECHTPDGYVADSKQPGYNTYYVAAITAFVERVKIVVVVDARKGACVSERPKLIGVNIVR
jgi:hypothetical protein